MDVVGMRLLGRRADLELPGDAAKLAEEVHPFANPQVVEVLLATHAPELIAGQFPLLGTEMIPERNDRQQVGAVDLEAIVELVGLLGLVAWSLTRVLDRQRRRDHEHLAHAAETIGFEHHPAEARVDRQARQ